MDPLQLHFGIGNQATIDSITVNWPSKDLNENIPKISHFTGPIDANQSLRIVEDIGFVGNKGDIGTLFIIVGVCTAYIIAAKIKGGIENNDFTVGDKI